MLSKCKSFRYDDDCERKAQSILHAHLSGVYLGPSQSEEPISSAIIEAPLSSAPSTAERRPHGASFVVSPDISYRPRSRSNQRVVEDHNAATFVTSGIFSTGNDIGAGTAEYVGVSLPFTVNMMLTLPGARRENAFSLSCDETEDGKPILVADDAIGEESHANEENLATTTARRVGISTPPPASDVSLFPIQSSRIATTPIGEFLLGSSKLTKIGSSVPVQRVTSLLVPGSFKSGGMGGATPKSLVSGSFGPLGRRDAGFYRPIAAKVRGERMERRSSTDVDDALGMFMLSFRLAIYLSLSVTLYHSLYLSIYLSICLSQSFLQTHFRLVFPPPPPPIPHPPLGRRRVILKEPIAMQIPLAN